jgi:hypothetical protein
VSRGTNCAPPQSEDITPAPLAAQSAVSYSAVVRARLREDFGETFAGVVRPSRGGLRWHRLWSLRESSIRWDRVRTCALERDRRPGVPRHTIRLLVEHDDGLLEVILRGPWGAIALAKLRDRIAQLRV